MKTQTDNAFRFRWVAEACSIEAISAFNIERSVVVPIASSTFACYRCVCEERVGPSRICQRDFIVICSMSAIISRGHSARGATRNSQRRKLALDVDLNAAPPCEHRNGEGTSRHQAGQQEVLPPQSVPIDVDLLDDDVVISSPRAFAEAKSNSRRYRGITVVDVEMEGSTTRHIGNNCNKCQRLPSNEATINCESYVNFEILAESTVGNGWEVARNVATPQLPPPPPPPKEATFNCPVCMGPLVEEMSTKCGHIFCKACIKTSISAQGKCPTCRRKVTMKDTIRIYLPATS